VLPRLVLLRLALARWLLGRARFGSLASWGLLAGVLALGAPAGAADWLDVVARALGISKTPSQLKSPGDELLSGDVYVVSVSGGVAMRVTRDGGYRSPVFLRDDAGVLAFKGENLVRLPLGGGAGATLHVVFQAIKLLGVSGAQPDEALLLVENAEGRAQVASLSLTSGRLAILPHNPGSKDHRRMLSSLRGDDRDYDGTSLSLRTESAPGLTGLLEWTDVYAKRAGHPAVNVSNGDGASCGQPSLSHDHQRVAFIKSEPAR